MDRGACAEPGKTSEHLRPMRRIWRSTAVVILTALTILLGQQPACACSCAEVTEQESFDYADLVFVGVITGDARPRNPMSSMDPVRIQFQVESVQKGSASPGTLVIETAYDGASCGWDYSVGHRYRVYVHEGQTGLCSGNRDLGTAPEVPLDPNFGGVSGWVIWSAVGGGVLVAGAIVAFFLLRRRRASAQLSA